VKKESIDQRLVVACREGDSEGVLGLIGQGADPNVIDKRDGSPILSFGIYLLSEEAILSIINAGADITRTYGDDWTFLHTAAKDGRSVNLVRRLLSEGIDANVLSKFKHTPALLSLNKPSSIILSVLFDAGATLKDFKREFELPLYCAMVDDYYPDRARGNPDIEREKLLCARILIDQGEDIGSLLKWGYEDEYIQLKTYIEKEAIVRSIKKITALDDEALGI